MEGTFAKANRIKEAAFAGRLKEATRDLGAAHVDTLRTIFAARVLQTRERLNGLTCSAGSQQLEATKSQQMGLRGNVRALGLGLLERTEAVLDLLLQLADAENQHHQLGSKACQNDENHGEDSSWRERIPRAFPVQVLQTCAVKLSEPISVKVTFVGMQDTCSYLAQRLRVKEFWQLLGSVHSWAEETQKSLTDDCTPGSSPRVASRAVQIARFGCEKLLPDRVGRFVNSYILVRFLGQGDCEGSEQCGSPEVEFSSQPSDDLNVGSVGQGTSLFVEEILEVQEDTACTNVGRHFLAELGDLGELHSGTGRCLRLVVKNSFIELVEEPSPRERRRARSCDPALLADDEESVCLDAHTPANAGPPTGGIQNSGRCLEDCASSPSAKEGLEQTASSFSCGPTVGAGTDSGKSQCLTVMLRNVPPAFGRSDLLAFLDGNGFGRRYDFVYLPVDFTHNLGLGYALVGLVDHESARAVMQSLQGLCFPSTCGSFHCEASWSEPHRGLAGHIERYRNSPVMHPSMPDEYKPVIFVNGQRVPFPPPTKSIRPPRIRHPKVEGKAVAQPSSAI